MALPHPAKGLRSSARLKSNDPLREAFFELFRRSYQQVEAKRPGSGLGVYLGSARVIRSLCGEPWAQAMVFPSESRLARRFLAETGLPWADPGVFIQESLVANLWPYTWTGILLKASREEFMRCCEMRGTGELEAALAAGRGVILGHSHTPFAQLFWRWLEHEGIDEGIMLWQWTWTRDRSELHDPKLRAIEGGRELYQARKILGRGGIVQVMADGGWGETKFYFPFFGRRRPFMPSFAELAVAADAAVLTVDASLATDGRIIFDIVPLAGATDGAREERIEALVRAYAEHLRRRWEQYAPCLEWYQMWRHLRYPRLA